MRPGTKRVLAALLTTVVVGSGVSAMATDDPVRERRADAPATYRHLKARIYTAPGLGTIAVGAPDPKHVMVQDLDEASGTWSTPRVLFRGAGRVTCGDITGRASAGGVALLLECDTPFYVDQAPAASVAVVTRDLRTYRRKTLPGEAYGAPAISPDGAYAAWLASSGFVEWGAGEGFLPLRSTTFDGDSGGETLVVTDDGTVSVIGPESPDGPCVLGVHERTLSGEQRSSQVDGVDPGCTEGRVENRNAFEVVGGGSDRPSRFVIRRADADSPWVLTSRAAITAPGLVNYEGSARRVIQTLFSDVARRPLVAYGSPDRRRVFVQRYDQAAQVWSPRELVHDQGFPGCASQGDVRFLRARVHALSLHCYPVERADGDYPPFADGFQAAPRSELTMLLSADGTTWRVVDIAGRPLGMSADRTLVAAPGARSTTIVSPEGITVLPVRAPATCGFVFPIDGHRLLRLHGATGARWPRLLQRLDGGTWRTIQRLAVPRQGACTRVRAFNDLGPTTYLLDGGGTGVALRVVRRDGAWRVVRVAGF